MSSSSPPSILPTQQSSTNKVVHGLNHRLQKYMVRMATMEAEKSTSKKEMQLMKDALKQEVQDVKTRLTNELNECRAALEHELDQKTRLQVLEQEQYREIGRLRKYEKEVEETKKQIEQMDIDRNKALKSNEDSKLKLAENANVLLDIKRQLASVQKDFRLQKTELKDAQNELIELREEKKMFLEQRETQLETLRREMSTEYQRSQAHWAADIEKRTAAAEAETRGHFNAVIDAQKKEVAELKQELSVASAALERVTNDYDGALELRQDLTERLNALDKQYQLERKERKDEKRSMEETISALRKYRAKKDEDFSALMDIKIALDSEIEEYRMILEREEERVGMILSPVKQRKRKSLGGLSSAKRSSAAKRKKSNGVKVVSLNLEENYAVVENMTDKDQCITKWKLKNLANKSYTFPVFTLKPYSKVKVSCTKSRKSKARGKKDKGMEHLSTKRYLWNSSGDMATLLNQENEVVCQLSQGDVPQPDDTSSAEAEDFMEDINSLEEIDSESNEKERCSIM